MSCAALGGEEQGSICDAVAVRKWRTMCSSGSIVSPHPCPSLVFPPPSQTTASGCCPRWDTKLCLRLNVLDLPIHVKQRKLFLSSYCSRLEVVEPQCWVWAAQTFTVNFLCAYESGGKCWDMWLMLTSISAEMSLPFHRWLLRKLTDRIRTGWYLSYPACTNPFQAVVKVSLGKWKWKVEWVGSICSCFSDHTCFHPRVQQSRGGTLTALLLLSAGTLMCLDCGKWTPSTIAVFLGAVLMWFCWTSFVGNKHFSLATCGKS